MRCEECGYENSKYDIICEKCGSPLNIENNIELTKSYNSKPRAIDIEAITPDHSKIIFNKTKQQVRYIIVFLLGCLFMMLLLIALALIKNIKDNDILKKYNDFMNNTEYGIIYIGEDEEVNNKVKKYSEDYDFGYLYISTGKITSVKKNRIKNNLHLEKIDSTLIIIENGKMLEHMNNSSTSNDKIENFLEKNNIIPKYIGDPNKYIKMFDESIKATEPTIIYIANNKNDSNAKHNKLLKEFCEEYSINYKFIEGYYLTNSQKLKLLKKVNYTDIHDEMLILVDEGEIKEASEFVSNEKKDYFELSSTYGIIDDTSAKNLKEIDLNKLKNIINSKEKNIIMFSSKNCNYCDRLKPIIGKISIVNNIDIYIFNIDEKNQNELNQTLLEYGFEDNISTPTVIISENSKILETIIGLSDKSIYDEKFKELGVIR